MTWSIGDPTIHNALFWGLSLFGLIIGTVAFLLMGRPFSNPQRGRPVLGLFCGLIFGASFVLLGLLMVDGRFFTATLKADTLALQMADGDYKWFSRDELESIRTGLEANANYLVITTRDGHFYRAGPCGPECGAMIAAVETWLADLNQHGTAQTEHAR